MAKLIDADAYAAEMREKQDECKAWKDGLAEGTELYARAEQSFVTFVEAALTLKSQPTIDAIPVEWLKHRLTMALKNGCDAPEPAIRYVLWLWEQQKDGEQEA